MKKLGLNFWTVAIVMLIGLGFIVWGGIIYSSYPGLKEIVKAARNTALLQYGIGIGCFILGWILLKFVKK